MASREPEHDHREEQSPAAEDEDTGAHVAPIVRLEEVAVTTGEEDEVAVLDLKAKLYRFDKDGKQWKERGAGSVKFLRHTETRKVRLLMRQSKTLKICANHLILPSMSVQEHAGNDKSCVWHARDFADGELKDEFFCIRFAKVEHCKEFMETFQEIAESQRQNEDDGGAAAAAAGLENLAVQEKVTEDKGKAGEDAPAVPVENSNTGAAKEDVEKRSEPASSS